MEPDSEPTSSRNALDLSAVLKKDALSVDEGKGPSTNTGVRHKVVPAVIYSQQDIVEIRPRTGGHEIKAFGVCNSLDDLLMYLEIDAIDHIIFDESVDSQEILYIIRWAKIFKPSLKCFQGKLIDGIFCFDAYILTDAAKTA